MNRETPKRARGAGRTLIIGLAALTAAAAPVALAAQEPADTVGGVLTLEEAVRVALRQSRDLQDARLALESAEGQVREAWGNVMPSLNLNASFTRNLTVPSNFLPRVFVDPDAGPDELVAVKFGADNQWSFQLRGEQPLFEGAAFVGVGAAARYRSLQEEAVRGRRQSVVTDVRLAYFDALLAQEAARLSENSLARVEQTLGETQAMYDAGLASEYDVLRLQVERNNLRPDVRRALNAVSAAKRTLAVQMGLEPTDAFELAGSLAATDLDDLLAAAPAGSATFVAAPADVDGDPVGDQDPALRQVLQRRSDVKQLALTTELRQAEVRAERAGFLPRVSVFGVYSINGQGNGDPAWFGQQQAYGRQVGVEVSLPVFSGFQRPARLDQKNAVLRQARTQHRLALAQAENQVKTLAEQVREAEERAQAQQLAVQQAQRGWEIARAQYREGLGSQLEVTDAELALRQSEFNFAEAVYDYLVAQARLDQATGDVPFVDDNGAATPLRTVGIR